MVWSRQIHIMTDLQHISIVIIGRNEGQRLVRCLNSATNQIKSVVYVDSGSDDGSQKAALNAGAELVSIESLKPFTAAKARNAGFDYLMQRQHPPHYVQFIDGDCELQPEWIKMARTFLDSHSDVAVVCGRRRERFPEASVYNRLIDQEWDTPVGEAKSCGGDALMRAAAVQQVKGFNPDLIAGEEPELCLRMRALNWKIWRLDAEATLHDAEILHFWQWWKRNKRAGFAFAEGTAMHGAKPERHGVKQTISALFWAVFLPFIALMGALITPWSILLLLAWPLQIVRLALRDSDWARAFYLTLGKLPEAVGAISYGWTRLRGMKATLIEYK